MKEFLKRYSYFKIIIVYSFILAIVYSYWMFVKDQPLWACILVGFGFLLLGSLISLIYCVNVNKKNKVNETNENEETTSEVVN